MQLIRWFSGCSDQILSFRNAHLPEAGNSDQLVRWKAWRKELRLAPDLEPIVAGFRWFLGNARCIDLRAKEDIVCQAVLLSGNMPACNATIVSEKNVYYRTDKRVDGAQ